MLMTDLWRAVHTDELPPSPDDISHIGRGPAYALIYAVPVSAAAWALVAWAVGWL